MLDEISDKIVNIFFRIFDTGVISAVIATVMGWVPNTTALFALLYLLIRIWETETIKRLTNRFK